MRVNRSRLLNPSAMALSSPVVRAAITRRVRAIGLRSRLSPSRGTMSAARR